MGNFWHTISHFNIQSRIVVRNPIHISRSFASYRNTPSLPSPNGFKKFGRPEFGPLVLGRRIFRVSSGGGAGGGFGGSGNGKSGGGGGNSGGGVMEVYVPSCQVPVMTKAVTSALLTLVGDVICQLVIDQVPSLDLKRTFTFTLLGLVLVGPTLHFWYLYLSNLVTAPGASGAFLRLFLDQFLFSPIFIGTFLSALVTLEGRPSDVIPKLKQEWFSSVVANWQLWIPFQFLNFRFVPQQFQKRDRVFGLTLVEAKFMEKMKDHQPQHHCPITSPLQPASSERSSSLSEAVSSSQTQSPSSSDHSTAFTENGEEAAAAAARNHHKMKLERKGTSFAYRIREHGETERWCQNNQKEGERNIFREVFGARDGEKLMKASQCYLSTTAGPIAGVLFISTDKVAFCSERSIAVESNSGGILRTPYKLCVPVKKIKGANESENVRNPAQKYIEIVTEDNFEFWFMGL
ncbi:UNVERIFIED_CONTAM: GEM-like protein 6 [Sesamum angustifolium]|uniref:GEM-like protein 6 n=1 Tax=Sesamum angustifolium TaxID=2727405 RepID=A0AAW2LKG5_9LAMI